MIPENIPESPGHPASSTVPLSWSSFYDPEQDAIVCRHEAGFFSMCCVSLWNLADLQRIRGRFPSRMDYSLNFRAFRNPEQVRLKTDMYPLFFKPQPACVLDTRCRLPHVAQHGIYRFVNYKRLNPVIGRFFQPSDRAIQCRDDLIRRYAIDPAKTIAVVYRGTDKGSELKIASPEAFLAVTHRLLAANPGHRVWIQTDEREVRAMFARAFADRCFYLHEMPVSSNGEVVHKQSDETISMDRSEFGVLLIAVNSLLAQADLVVNHTGNMALWLCLFRGHARGIWQFDDEGRIVNPSAPACYWAVVRRLMIKASSWSRLRRFITRHIRSMWRL
jgi:hypothetical protein